MRAKKKSSPQENLLSIFVHQLRTPLTALSWYSEMLAGTKETAEQRLYIGKINELSARMSELLRHASDIANIEQNRFTLHPQKLSLVTVVESVLTEMQPLMTSKKQELLKKYEEAVFEVIGDPVIARIILQNVISNAVKYTPEGGILSITMRRDKKNICIEIKDNGYGIPKAEQNHIFKKSYRGKNIHAQKTEGNGLGLYIVKIAARRAKVAVSFDSTANKGTSFFLTFPPTCKN